MVGTVGLRNLELGVAEAEGVGRRAFVVRREVATVREDVLERCGKLEWWDGCMRLLRGVDECRLEKRKGCDELSALEGAIELCRVSKDD